MVIARRKTADSAHLAFSALLLFSFMGLSACSQSYVVLLAEEDGSLGKVVVSTPRGATTLEKDRDAVNMTENAGETFTATEEQIQKDFGRALAASPQKPVSYYLYFIEGTARLTPESQNEIPKIIDEMNRRPAVDISVIGHTDTIGNDRDNARLSLARAQSVATLFVDAMTDAERITIDSHGEKNLLIPTPDNTGEPRNRRVEITIR
ncbi:OmpA family protein [Methylomonas sp. MgM2]